MTVRRSFGPQRVALITRYFVPVVVTGSNQVSIQSASGRILGPDIDAAIQAFRLLPESERKPNEIPPAPPSDFRLPVPTGGTVIRVFTRGFDSDHQGTLHPIARHVIEYSGPQREFLWLTAEESQSLIRPELAVGAEYSMPPAIVQRICRFYLLDNTICLPRAWSPNECRAARISLHMDAKNNGLLHLSISGTAPLASVAAPGPAARAGDFSICGRLVYNAQSRRFEQFDLVALGDYHDRGVSKDYEKIGKRSALTLGFAFELATPDSLGYGTVPFALWNGVHSCRPGSPQIMEYFGIDPYRPQ